jgi:beta-galactosidase
MPSGKMTRRSFVGTTTFMALGLPVVLGRAYPALAALSTGAPYAPPKSPRTTLNFNYDWRFIKGDVLGAEVSSFDDSKWDTVATPHSFNDVDSFRNLISHGGGDTGTYKGLSWYRKHFKLPADLAGHKVFIEFEGMRQAGDIYLNGKAVGLYENGITAYGIDITDALQFAPKENVLAVKVDNSTRYEERAFCMANPKNADGTPCVPAGYEWNANDFNPDHGGINLRQRLQPRPRRHQSPRLAACDRQDSHHASSLLRPGEPGHLHLSVELRHRQENRRRNRGSRSA